MHLVMFDLDGTLMQSNALDVQCFTEAIHHVTGIASIDGDWSRYRHVTDEGIISEIVIQAFGRPAAKKIVRDIRARILQILQQEINANGWKFLPIPGAIELIQQLAGIENCGVAIATGSWKESAYMKMAAAGFHAENLPLASSDDSHRRHEIMAAALQRAEAFYKVRAFETVTYVGDGMWDLHASRQLGYHFIGIGFNNNRARMLAEGASQVLADFSDPEAFFTSITKIWNRS